MKKYIFVLNAIELLKQIAVGRRISGVLYIDENTGCLTFKAYNRKPRRVKSSLDCWISAG